MHSSDSRSRECGFTFVEIVVVALIVTILSAVSIPLYRGYAVKQRQDAVNNMAQAAAISANAYFRRHGIDPDSARLGLFLPQQGRFLIRVLNPNVIVRDAEDPDNIQATVRYRN